jgi:hypothetical protein
MPAMLGRLVWVGWEGEKTDSNQVGTANKRRKNCFVNGTYEEPLFSVGLEV